MIFMRKKLVRTLKSPKTRGFCLFLKAIAIEYILEWNPTSMHSFIIYYKCQKYTYELSSFSRLFYKPSIPAHWKTACPWMTSTSSGAGPVMNLFQPPPQTLSPARPLLLPRQWTAPSPLSNCSPAPFAFLEPGMWTRIAGGSEDTCACACLPEISEHVVRQTTFCRKFSTSLFSL